MKGFYQLMHYDVCLNRYFSSYFKRPIISSDKVLYGLYDEDLFSGKCTYCKFIMASYSVAKMCLHFTNVYNIYVFVCIYQIINYYSRMFRYLSLAFRHTCQVHLPEKAIFSHPPHSTNDFLSLFTPSLLYELFPVHLDRFFSFIYYTYHMSMFALLY